jgi:hypothetical protein
VRRCSFPAMTSPGTTTCRGRPRYVSVYREFTPLSERRCGQCRLHEDKQQAYPKILISSGFPASRLKILRMGESNIITMVIYKEYSLWYHDAPIRDYFLTIKYRASCLVHSLDGRD